MNHLDRHNVIKRIFDRYYRLVEASDLTLNKPPWYYTETLYAASEALPEINLMVLLESVYDFDFTHDVEGICSHWDHEKHEMKDCFLPRCWRLVNEPA